MSELMIERKNGKIKAPLKGEKWLDETPEETVRQEYVCRLVNDYGYSLDQMDQEVSVSNSKRGQGQARADIVVWKHKDDKRNGKKAIIIVECKAQNITIRIDDYYQGQNYASWAGASFFVTTNQKETKYFNVDADYLPKQLSEIIAIPTAKELDDERKVKELLEQTKTFTREAFTRVLFKCHNIIRNNDKLSPEAAFDEISKILFMKIRYERDQKGRKVFTKKEFEAQSKNHESVIRPNLRNTPKDLPYMQFMFGVTKEEFKDDKLFDANEVIRIRENSFADILEELQSYNLSGTDDDVKGIAFEEFLGKTFRGELGQFFTPRTIVDFMTRILDPQEGETICDPTCGSGGFLIHSFEYIRSKIETDVQMVKERFKKQLLGDDFASRSSKEQTFINQQISQVFNILNKELEHVANENFESRLWNLSHNCIYGTDANPRMARTSKMNMIMHGDGHGGVHHHDGLLNINGIFDNRFDVILTNPPFGARIDKTQKITETDRFTDEALIAKYTEKYKEAYTQALSQVNDNIGKPLLDLYGELGKMSGLTEVLFIERCINLLKPGGRMGIVLPEGVLNNAKLQSIREWFEGRAKIILICSIPQDVFVAAGATVKPSLVFLKKFTDIEAQAYKKAVNKARVTIRDKYLPELTLLKDRLVLQQERLKPAKVQTSRNSDTYKKLMAEDKELTRQIKEIEKRISEEAKPLTKELFDYEIPIAKVDDGGITTTGVKTENKELTQLCQEYAVYNKKAKLWQTTEKVFKYVLTDETKILRICCDKEENLK